MPSSITTHWVGRACDGDQSAVAWVVERFSPLLVSQASALLRTAGRPDLDPHDIVQETWIETLPQLSKLARRANRITPVLVRFLGTILQRRVARGTRPRAKATAVVPFSPDASVFDRLAVGEGSPVHTIIRSESVARVRSAIDQLGEPKRSVVLMRAVEGLEPAEVGARLNLPRATVNLTYHRALEDLRETLQDSVFNEL